MSGRDNVESSGDEQRKQTLGGARSGTTWVEVTHPLGMVLDPARAEDPDFWITRGFADPTPCSECGGTGVVWATTGEDYTCYRCVNEHPYVQQGPAPGQPDIPEPGRHDGSSRTRDGPPGSGDDDHRAEEEAERPKVEELMIQFEAQAKETGDYDQRMSWQQQHPEVDEKGNSPSRARSFPPFMIKHPDGPPRSTPASSSDGECRCPHRPRATTPTTTSIRGAAVSSRSSRNSSRRASTAASQGGVPRNGRRRI